MAIQFEYSIRDHLKAVWTITDDHVIQFVESMHRNLAENPTKITVHLDTDACVNSSALKKMAEGLSRVMTLRDYEKKIIVFKRPYDTSVPHEMEIYLEGFKRFMTGPTNTPFLSAAEAGKLTERHRETTYQRHQRQIASQIKEAITLGKFDTHYSVDDSSMADALVVELTDNGYNVDVFSNPNTTILIQINWNLL
jgi:hypothetical protein